MTDRNTHVLDLYTRHPISAQQIIAKVRASRGHLENLTPEDFSTGTLGLWSSNHFVIYYRDGRVPQPGIILLGRATGDVSFFDRPGPVTVRVERIN